MPNGGKIGTVDSAEQARIEKSLRKKLATPKYPDIFYLAQAFKVHSHESVAAPPTGTTRCSSVARSERGISGTRAGWGGAIREPVSCALEEGHSGSHKGVSFPFSASKMQSHWEWSDPPVIGSKGADVPEDAAEMGRAAIATFSGRVFDGTNQGVQGMLPPSFPMAELWRHAGVRFRIDILVGAVSIVAATVLVMAFLSQPRWQVAAAMGAAFVIFVVAGVQAGEAMGRYQQRLKALGGEILASKPPLGD
jgi:hypothetical protein